MSDFRTCRECHGSYAIDKMKKHRNKSDGIDNICLVCHAKQTHAKERTARGICLKWIRGRGWADLFVAKQAFLNYFVPLIEQAGPFKAVSFYDATVEDKNVLPKSLKLFDDHGHPLIRFVLTPSDALVETCLPKPKTEYVPKFLDERIFAVKKRPTRHKQQQFRKRVQRLHGGLRCFVTGVVTRCVVKAAHQIDYRGDNDNHPSNGLLLRADVHDLYDRFLLGIDPETLAVHVHDGVTDESYRQYHGSTLNCDKSKLSSVALKWRWDRYNSSREPASCGM